MAKFRYYVTDLFEGCVKGTDDRVVAMQFAESDDFFVVDTETGEWMMEGGECQPVKPYEGL